MNVTDRYNIRACGRPSKARRQAFTLVEVLVVIAILAILVGLLLPAISSVRMTAMRAACQNNLKQLGLALINFEVTNGALPVAGEYLDPATKSTRHTPHYFFTHVLPFMEQESVGRRVSTSLLYNQGANAVALNGVAIKAFVCPVNPARHDDLDPDGYGCVDYAPAPYVDIDPATGLKSSNPAHRAEGALGHRTGRKAYAVTDGMSNSVALYEDVGRSWVMSQSRYADPLDGQPRRFWRWAEPDNAAGLSGKINNCRPDLSDPNAAHCPWMQHDVAFSNEPFSFHPGDGCHLLFCDGSVRWAKATVSPFVLRGLVTFNAGDYVHWDD